MPPQRPGEDDAGVLARTPEWFRPIQILDVELARPLASTPAGVDTHGRPYEKALALIRVHGRPIATVAFDLPAAGLGADALGEAIQNGLDPAMLAQMSGEWPLHLPGYASAATSALPSPADVAARDAFLARAPFASVVIATRNRPDNLARCLASVAAQVYPEFEIIVVDNAPSDDATERFFAEHYAAQSTMHYVREDRPGLASAHNRGVREMRADSQFVAFTDDDVEADPYWLCELMRGFEAAANVGCVTGMIFPAELETWPQLLIEEFGGFNKGFQRRIYDLKAHRPDDQLFPFTPGRFGSGANMAFERGALDRIGGFDPAVGTGTKAMGGDDLAAFFRTITEGYALVYEPAAIVRHTHYRDFSALQRQIYGYGVGLTAFLAKALQDQPHLALDLAGKLPRGMWYALSSSSGKNRKKGVDYPEELTRLERKGMLYGPVAYVRSRLAARTYEQSTGPIILMYHQVGIVENDPWKIAVTPRHFAEHLEVLSRQRQPVALREVTADLGLPQLDQRQVAVTFDDGYADNLTNAKPLLEQFEIPATVFVVGDAIGAEREFWWDALDRVLLGKHPLPAVLSLRIAGQEHLWELADRARDGALSRLRRPTRRRLRRMLWARLREIEPGERWRIINELQAWAGLSATVREDRRVMTEEEVRTLAEGGLVEIGAHTASHPRLAALPAADQFSDIVRGKERLEAILHAPVNSFSYPFGGRLDVSTATVAAVRTAGFLRACTTRPGVVQTATNPLRLPRIYVGDWSGEEFERRLATWL
ncbi:MAG: glycosyltransferase [Chloroflexota bacterium]|nr:glycosyltransferase [Chloroflexota bacterium]